MISVVRFEVRVFPEEDWRPKGSEVARFARNLRECADGLGGRMVSWPSAIDLIEPRDLLYGLLQAEEPPFSRGPFA